MCAGCEAAKVVAAALAFVGFAAKCAKPASSRQHKGEQWRNEGGVEGARAECVAKGSPHYDHAAGRARGEPAVKRQPGEVLAHEADRKLALLRRERLFGNCRADFDSFTRQVPVVFWPG